MGQVGQLAVLAGIVLLIITVLIPNRDRITQWWHQRRSSDIRDVSQLWRGKAQDTTVDEEILNIDTGGSFRVDTSGNNSVTGFKYQVTGKGRLHAQHRINGGELQDRGEIYDRWDGDDFVLIKRPEGWFFFNKREVLAGDGDKPFLEGGKIFDAQHQQKPRAFSMPWTNTQGQDFMVTFVDIGYLQFHRISGRTHLADKKQERYVWGEINDPTTPTIFHEVIQHGPRYVWYGIFIGYKLDNYVLSVESN